VVDDALFMFPKLLEDVEKGELSQLQSKLKEMDPRAGQVHLSYKVD
jgi:hypothetical protein